MLNNTFCAVTQNTYVWHCHCPQNGVNVSNVIFGYSWITVLKLIHKWRHTNKGDMTYRMGRADWKSDCFYIYCVTCEFWLALWDYKCLCMCGVGHMLLGITKSVSYGSSKLVPLKFGFRQRRLSGKMVWMQPMTKPVFLSLLHEALQAEIC